MTETTPKGRGPISVLDLTVRQTEAIEKDIGLPMTDWGSCPSMALLLSSVLAAIEGKPREEYLDWPMSKLADAVDLGEPDPNG